MKLYQPENLADLFSKLEDSKGEKFLLAGGTDINVQIKNGVITDGDIFFINHLSSLKGIKKVDNKIHLGSLTSYNELINSDLVKEHLPFLQDSLTNFASPLLTTMATIGGNIANGSPTNDVTPPLLVLDAELELISKSGSRIVPLKDFFTGYKKFLLEENEIIKGIIIPIDAEKGYNSFYEKVGARKTLTIAKVAFAGLKKTQAGNITEIKLAVGSLNEYPRRLQLLEEFLINKQVDSLKIDEISEVLSKEITPISDLRSDKEYRYKVCLNLIRSFLDM